MDAWPEKNWVLNVETLDTGINSISQNTGIQGGLPELKCVLLMGIYTMVLQSEISTLMECVSENFTLGYKDKDIYTDT